MHSPLFHTAPETRPSDLAILHLKRDSLVPVILQTSADDGYAEGAVTNTRFGSFPHSTLIGLPWGSQVRASRVDTGTRGRVGRKGKEKNQVFGAAAVGEGGEGMGGSSGGEGMVVDDGRVEMASQPRGNDVTTKRKSDEVIHSGAPVANKKLKTLHADGDAEHAHASSLAPKMAIEAGSGFIHLLQPSPESWTASLDHRTQVVYPADYSYILQRLRVRPGSHIIEAGAGSGSFTHAAARAVFSGTPIARSGRKRSRGKVYSYEFHEPRVQSLSEELSAHGLNDVVHLTHRNVCEDGFLLTDPDQPSPNAEAIFLDLPAPWQALKHLVRSPPVGPSPLKSQAPVHVCTFSPCIEQVMATTAYLRKNGWTEIEMVVVHHHRIDVRRDQVGLRNEGLRGVNAAAATVEEAVGRLREVEQKLGDYHAARNDMELHKKKLQSEGGREVEQEDGDGDEGQQGKKKSPWHHLPSKAERLAKLKKEAEERKLYKEGNLVHRTEPEVKTHTSYLVFAILPMDWREEDERAAIELWPVNDAAASSADKTNVLEKKS